MLCIFCHTIYCIFLLACWENSVNTPELEKVKKDEMIWDMVEDKRRYARYYSKEELEDEIK